MTLVSSFTDILQQLSYVMTAPTFNTFLTILTGWVFARRRTVTGMILAADAVGKKHHSAFHRFFAAARWQLDDLGLAVFDLILSWLPDGTIFLALDDTLARKRGLKIFGVGMHHDPLLSTRKKAIVNWGHSWVVLGVIVRLPFGRRRYACLPILFRLYVNKQTATPKRLAYRTRPQLAVEMLTWYARRWSIEVAFQNSKTHLGFEQPQGWSRQAVQRTAPMAMLLTSLITLWFAQVGHRHYRPLNRPWYRQKRQPSFADLYDTSRFCDAASRRRSQKTTTDQS